LDIRLSVSKYAQIEQSKKEKKNNNVLRHTNLTYKKCKHVLPFCHSHKINTLLKISNANTQRKKGMLRSTVNTLGHFLLVI